MVTEALTRYTPEVPAIGVCNVPITAKMHILSLLERRVGEPIDADRTQLKTLGLNHLSWHRGFTVDGEDVWPIVIKATLAELRASDHPEWHPELIEMLQMLPNYYLQYYYHTAKKLAEQNSWPPSRAEAVMEVEKDLLAEYADLDRTEPPADLMKRGGAYYSTLATQLLNAHYNDLNETHIVNVSHRGAVPGWPADWVLEMPGAREAAPGSALCRPIRCRHPAPACSPQSKPTSCSPSKLPSTATAKPPTRPCSSTRSAPRRTRWAQS